MIRMMLALGQIGLAIMFGFVGFLQIVAPKAELLMYMPWIVDVPIGLVRTIGVFELIAAFGLIVPAIMRYKTHLVAYAALGLAVIMVLACIFHFMRGEWSNTVATITAALGAIFVYWGRMYHAPINGRDNYNINDFSDKHVLTDKRL